MSRTWMIKKKENDIHCECRSHKVIIQWQIRCEVVLFSLQYKVVAGGHQMAKYALSDQTEIDSDDDSF